MAERDRQVGAGRPVAVSTGGAGARPRVEGSRLGHTATDGDRQLVLVLNPHPSSQTNGSS